MSKEKAGYEYVHSCYTIDNTVGSNDDAIFVKRNKITWDENGEEVITPEFTYHENLKRDFWITKKAYQKHSFKLEYECLSKLNHYTCTERDLPRQISYKLGIPYNPNKYIMELLRSPYVYGCDMDITSVLKLKYKKIFPRETPSNLSYSVQDIEFDMNSDLGMIIFSMSFKDKAHQVILKDWVNKGDTEEEYKDFIINELPEIKERNIDLGIEFVNNMADGIKKIYEKANEWMPDILGIWNIDYDIPIILDVLKKHGVDPKDIFSHPSVPPKYRKFVYDKGPVVKRKDDGTSRPLAPSEQWHTILCTAPFYFIDPMSLHRGLNKTKAEKNYSLDYLTNKYLGAGKYKFNHELLTGTLPGDGRWHKLMQKHFKKQYCAYGLIDCIRVEQFDEELENVAVKLPLLLGDSKFKDFSSNPKQLCDDFHSFCIENDSVMGTTSNSMKHEIDSLIVGKEGWINIGEATHLEDIGIRLVDDPAFRSSRLTIHNFDSDLVSVYPRIGILTGLSRRNTVFEVCKLEGIPSMQHRYISVNLTGGCANAITTCKDLYKLDSLDELHHKFAVEHNLE